MRSKSTGKQREPRWNESNIRIAAEQYTSRSEFAEKNKPAYEAARLMNLLDVLFDLKLNQWGAEQVRKEALKYTSRTQMAKLSGAAYNAARRLGILSDLFESRLRSWGVDEVETAAIGCRSKKDLKIKNATAYNAALRLKIIDRLFDNEGRVRERDSVYLWEVSDEPGLFKVGITSSSMGDFRIHQVAKEAKVKPRLIFLCVVGYENAKHIEREMKKLGKPYKFTKKFYGFSEFRYMTTTDVQSCVNLVMASY